MGKADFSKLTDREQLEAKTQATIEWHFGSGICDPIEDLRKAGKISDEDADALKRSVRRAGNDAIRVCKSHLNFYVVTRRHEMDKPNIARAVAKAAIEQGEPS